MNARWFGFFAGLALLFPPCMVQSQQEPKSRLALEANDAFFRYDASDVCWELYYSYNQNQLTGVRQPDGSFQYQAAFRLKIMKGDSTVTERGWRTANTVQDTSAKSRDAAVIDRVKFQIKPGAYGIVFQIMDAYAPSNSDSLSFSVEIDPISSDRMALSDIELALRVQKNFEDKANSFYKNTLYVLPNPGAVYGVNSPFLYFYMETYNADKMADPNYVFQYFVKSDDGKTVSEIPVAKRTRSKTAESSVEWGAVKVGSLKSGKYLLHVDVVDQQSNTIDFKEKPFFVFNPEKVGNENAVVMDPDQLFLISEFNGMTEGAMKDELKKASYLLNKSEKNELKKIKDLAEQQKWLFKFWKSKDTNSSTPQNEFRIDFMNRVAYANQNFRSFQSEGWLTDRGRVYILYGEPDYINQYPNEENKRPYEVWNYNQIQGGVEFVFCDFNMNREYRLIHSTMRGEVQNDSWETMLEKGQL
jgi:GWxTD domain-containing protein